MILKTLRRDRISTAREALHGARSPSMRTPESRKTLGTLEGLAPAIKAAEAAPTYFAQVLQSLLDGNSAARKGVLDALAKTKKGNVRGDHHQRLTELTSKISLPFESLCCLRYLGGTAMRPFSPTRIASIGRAGLAGITHHSPQKRYQQ